MSKCDVFSIMTGLEISFEPCDCDVTCQSRIGKARASLSLPFPLPHTNEMVTDEGLESIRKDVKSRIRKSFCRRVARSELKLHQFCYTIR